MKIPFNKPTSVGTEAEYINQALNGRISGDGSFTKKCNAFFEETLGVHKALLTTSCTHALEMSAILLDIQPGDEVIVPSFTFVSTINAYVLRGAKPVFIDIRPDTLNLDEALLPGLITSRTKAIVPVHYAGIGCEMDAIMAIAQEHGIAVVEDNAHGLFATYRDQNLGTIGHFATQSFHETKNFTCGEGGALFINDAEYAARAEIIREKGTNRSQFLRGEIDKYSWVDVGSSYLPSDILAAMLYAQLEKYTEIQARRAHIWDYYYQNLQDWATQHNILLPTVPADRTQSYHIFYMLMPSLDVRQALIAHMKRHEVSATFHYVPLHNSKKGQLLGGQNGACTVTEDVSDRLLRLPFYTSLTDEELDYILHVLWSFEGW